MKIALAQINTTIGDFSGNAQKIIEFTRRARQQGAELVVFPELSICGYPPRDFLENTAFVSRNMEVAEQIARETASHNGDAPIGVVCGLVTPARAETGKSVMNSAALLREGKVAFMQQKMLLPTYDVFDELRYFAPASKQEVLPLNGNKVALTICEDAWNDKHFWHKRLYSVDPVEELMRSGSNLIVNISASPFSLGKQQTRRRMLQAAVAEFKAPVVMVNQVGGNDSLIFDGSSFAMAPDGRVVAQCKSFAEDLVLFDSETFAGDVHEQPCDEAECAYRALVLGTCDYVRKCGFKQVIIGLSGGIDSALTAAIAVDALGKENVIGVSMPGPYSSQHSINDAIDLAKRLGIRCEKVCITDLYHDYIKSLTPSFRGLKPDLTEENIQARIRGNIVMAFGNKLNALVLATSNKSEMAVGYSTLYGDMCGALAVIADVPKTMVYRLSHYRNSIGEVIPESTITKPPSAELRPDQKDTDSLPEYDVLDAILEAYVERYRTVAEIVAEHGFDRALVERVIKMVQRSEYKRQQAAPVLKITAKAFGEGRRFPIAAKNEV